MHAHVRPRLAAGGRRLELRRPDVLLRRVPGHARRRAGRASHRRRAARTGARGGAAARPRAAAGEGARRVQVVHLRSEEHTSELQSLMRISYAVFCLKKKNNNIKHKNTKAREST